MKAALAGRYPGSMVILRFIGMSKHPNKTRFPLLLAAETCLAFHVATPIKG